MDGSRETGDQRAIATDRIETDYSQLDMGGAPGGDAPVRAELDVRFTYAAPKGDQPLRYVALRAAVRSVADLMVRWCPPSRERALALTHLEDAVMWANASIARRE